MTVIAHIEDNIGDHVLLSKALKDLFEIRHFSDLPSFMNSKESFDLIVEDLRLPSSYGFEIIEDIRSRYNQTPLVILTGLGGFFMTGDLIKALIDHGADNVISKELLFDPLMTDEIKTFFKSYF